MQSGETTDFKSKNFFFIGIRDVIYDRRDGDEAKTSLLAARETSVSNKHQH